MKKEDKKVKGESVSDSSLEGMYKEYFLDYASYVILERAVPSIEDGFKPVQRRILHSMKVMDDGRFHKVANIIDRLSRELGRYSYWRFCSSCKIY